jgi:hypothetical protein
MTSDTCPAALHFFGFPDTNAEIRVERHAQPDRVKRGLKALFACWGIAVLTVLIPIAHFVLVPAFLALGILLFTKRLREQASIVGLTGTCPRCQATGPFEASGRLRAHAKAQCGTCRNELDLAVDPSCVKPA